MPTTALSCGLFMCLLLVCALPLSQLVAAAKSPRQANPKKATAAGDSHHAAPEVGTAESSAGPACIIGKPCSDNNPCTLDDTCMKTKSLGNLCLGRKPFSCSPPSSECFEEPSWEPSSRLDSCRCIYESKAKGTPCQQNTGQCDGFGACQPTERSESL